MTDYRPDLDGLRAIAVASVLLYHAAEPLVPGGFVGVDIFFVISGYLITKLIATDVERRQFSLASFYVRRTKRILPALFLVLFTTLALSLWLLTPSELAQYGRTMAATAGFSSNILFWQDTGYFDTAAERKPLLHMWSLAVEEQFYLLWPVALLVLARTRWRNALVVIAMTVSFVTACYVVMHHQPTAFFLLPTRAWELLTGALLALGLVPQQKDGRYRTWCATAGLGLILVAVLGLNRDVPFPGVTALVPCLGAVLLIASGEGAGNPVSRRLLGAPPLVFIGLISYSLYLWHWPLLTLARVTQHGTLPPVPTGAVMLLSVVLAYLTWRFVEGPLRAKAVTPPAMPVLARYAVLIVATAAVGVSLHRSAGLMAWASDDVKFVEQARHDINPKSRPCLRWQSETGPLPQEPCLSDGDVFPDRLVIWGDSHADAVAPGLVLNAREHHLASHQLTMAGCPPLIGVDVAGDDGDYAPCSAFNAQVFDYIRAHPAVHVVALVARWPLYTENRRFGRDDPGPINFLTDAQDRAHDNAASRRVFLRAIDRTVSSLRSAGKRVIIIGSIPPHGVNVPDCLARNYMPLSEDHPCRAIATEVLPHLEWTDSRIAERFSGADDVCTAMPKEVLCREHGCLAVAEGEVLYANDDHVSLPGALFLGRWLNVDACLRPPARWSLRSDETPP